MKLYTLCFIRDGDDVLMLRRLKPPNAGKLNGVGGKIERGETPDRCVMRETREETGLEVTPSFGCLVTWDGGSEDFRGAMYVYVADLPRGIDPQSLCRQTPEGELLWVPSARLYQPSPEITDNICYYIRSLLLGMDADRIHFTYADGCIQNYELMPLASFAPPIV